MKVKELMERIGINNTGKAVAYIKDGLEEMAMLSETHVKTVRINIDKDKRFYQIPNEAVRLLDIRCKSHDNEDSLYKSIPRAIYEPATEDSDGI